MAGPALRAAAEQWFTRLWWQPRPGVAARLMQPLSALYGALARRARRAPEALPVPVVVVGNVVVGGAGKTPTVIALVNALRAAGWRPGVVSRGHGRASDGVQAVSPGDSPSTSGDEPLLIRRRTGVPVWVGRARVQAARALLQAHPAVNVIVSDDGLQHRALPRQAEVVVFDERGIGNGLLLPAGPLREPLPRPGPAAWPAQRWVLYNAPHATTALPGALAQRAPGAVTTLADWQRGTTTAPALPLSAFRGRPLLAAAGIAAPERFFAMLESAGLRLQRLPLPDHFDYTHLPWPPGTPEVMVTEKDAVKIAPSRVGATKVWVVALDFRLPPDIVQAVLQRLGPPPP